MSRDLALARMRRVHPLGGSCTRLSSSPLCSSPRSARRHCRAAAMGDQFTAAPYRGDPGIPHARESNFTAVVGGCWAFLGMTYLKDFVEVRPAWNPDHVMAVAEEAHKRRCLREGKQYKKLPSPIPADNLPENADKTPRIVKWKLDRYW